GRYSRPMTDTTRPTSTAAANALVELADEAWTTTLEVAPLYATAIGDRRFLTALKPNDEGATERETRRFEGLLARTQGLRDDELTPADRVTRAALADPLRYEVGLVGSGLARWTGDPLDGPQVELLNVASYQPIGTAADGRAAVERWRAMGPWIDRHVEGLRASSR